MRTIAELARRFVVYAMTERAKAVMRRYSPKILVVTGGVGKTLTKDAIYTALSPRFFVRRSEKNYNADIGVPLTILGVPNGRSDPVRWVRNYFESLFLTVMLVPYPRWLVLEVGADRPGDITKALSWLEPDIVVATRFPAMPTHVEFYESPKAVIAEELAPAAWLPAAGAFIANADDEAAGAAPAAPEVKRMTYGFSSGATVKGNRFHLLSKGGMPAGISFDVVSGEKRAHIMLPGVLGRQHAYPILAGVATALAAGIGLSKAAEAFSGYRSPPGRMRIIEGMRGSAVIDDSYNASPAATEEALGTLAAAPRKGKRIAILADMLELGTFSVEAHEHAGEIAARSCDMLITAGIRARGIAAGAKKAGMTEEKIIECDRPADAAAQAVALVGEGDIVLVKGSLAMRMERVVKALMANPSKAKELLVRQEREWFLRQ